MEGFGDPFCRRCFDFRHADERLLEFFRKLGEIREKYRDIFTEGEYEEVYEKDGCFAFRRVGGAKAVYVCVNLSREQFCLSVPSGAWNLLTDETLPSKISLKYGDYYCFLTGHSN